MEGRGGSNSSLRKYLGSIKDTTTISLAKVNSGYKELDNAVVKATNHVERPAKERHLRAIFAAVSATRPRADVAYCIHILARRLAKTHNWAVALKTLIVIHRALRGVDPTFHEELINYGQNRTHMLNISHFKDDSSASDGYIVYQGPKEHILDFFEHMGLRCPERKGVAVFCKNVWRRVVRK